MQAHYQYSLLLIALIQHTACGVLFLLCVGQSCDLTFGGTGLTSGRLALIEMTADMHDNRAFTLTACRLKRHASLLDTFRWKMAL